MEIDGSHLCPKRWLIFTNLGPGLSQQVDLFLIFEPILRAGFFDKMLALSNKKNTFVLVFGFFAIVFSKFYLTIIIKIYYYYIIIFN